MHNYRSVRCYYCKSVILYLPDSELKKLNGLNFMCECCGHQNHLKEFNFIRTEKVDSSVNTYSFERIAAL